MKRRTWSVVTGAGLGLLMVAASGVTMGVAAAAPAGPVGPTAVVSKLKGPDVRGIAVGQEGVEAGVGISAAVIGLDPAATYRLVASATPCGSRNQTLAVLATAQGLGRWRVVKTVKEVLPDGVDPIVSIRVLRTKPSRAQAACGNAGGYAATVDPTSATPAPAAPIWKLNDMLISSYQTGGAQGIVLLTPRDLDTVKLDYTLWARGSRHRLVGSTAPCGAAQSSANTVFKVRFDSPAARFADVRDGTRNTFDLQSVRIFRGAGFADEVRCSGIIGVLIAL